MWIKVHSAGVKPNTIFVQTEQICAIYKDLREQRYNCGTIIQFSGEENNYVGVSESADEIMEMIRKHER